MKCAKRHDNSGSLYDSKPCKLRKITADEESDVTYCIGASFKNESDDMRTDPPQDGQNLEVFPNSTDCSDEANSDDLAHGDEEMETILQCSSEIMHIVSEMAITDDEANIILTAVMNDLKCALQKFNCPFSIFPFGSHVNGLACKTSDVDFYFKLISDNPGVSDIQGLLKRAAKMLDKSRNFYTVARIRNARIPIVKFQHKFTGKDCDMSFSGELGLRNTLLIRYYLSMNSNLKPLVLFLKYLLQRYNLHGQGRITTFMLFWLVVYYMQQRDILPPVMTVREFVNEPYIVNGWDCRVPNNFAQPFSDPFSVLFHVKEFLKFYSNFEFLKYVISPHLACAILIGDFENLRIPSDVFTSYLTKMENEDDVKFSTSVINLQDPTEHNCNITKPIEIDNVNRFKTFCYFLYDFFTFELGAKLKSAQTLADALPDDLPNDNFIHSDWTQYMCLKLNQQRLPPAHELRNTFEKDGIRYFSDLLEKIMQTMFELSVEKFYMDDVKSIYRIKDEVKVSTFAMSCLICSAETITWKNVIAVKRKIKKEKIEPQVNDSSDSLDTFIVLNSSSSRKEIRIFIESKANFVSHLKSNLLNLLLAKTDVTSMVKSEVVSETKPDIANTAK